MNDGYDFMNDDADPMDDGRHGTNVAEIIASQHDDYPGIAPDASLYAVKVLNQYGVGNNADVLAGLECAVDPDNDPLTDDAAHYFETDLRPTMMAMASATSVIQIWIMMDSTTPRSIWPERIPFPPSLYPASFDASATPAILDFNGDGKSEFARRYAASFGNQLINDSGDVIMNTNFGRNTRDVPLIGDFGGDGNADIQRVVFGRQAEDVPVPADYDGDGITDFAVYRPSTHFWYVKNSSGFDPVTFYSDGVTRYNFVTDETDVPDVADYDGDGRADIAYRHPQSKTWYIRNSSGVNPNMPTDNRISQMQFGGHSMSMPIPADYDGDGYADLALHDPRNRKFHILNSSGSNYNSVNGNGEQLISFSNHSSFQDDIVMPADYDGDGITDIAVKTRRADRYTVRYSRTGEFRTLRLGTAFAIPVASPVKEKMRILAVQ